MRRRPARALVVRTGAFFGPWDESNFVAGASAPLAAGEPFAAADDLTVSPTYVPDLVHACLDLLIDGERGVWHLANAGAVTWAELARGPPRGRRPGRGAASRAGPPRRSAGRRRRPPYSVLGSERACSCPPGGRPGAVPARSPTAGGRLGGTTVTPGERRTCPGCCGGHGRRTVG